MKMKDLFSNRDQSCTYWWCSRRGNPNNINWIMKNSTF